MTADRGGVLWLATGDGLVRYDGRGFQRYTVADGLADDTVFKALPTKAGMVWVGTPNGLSRLTDGKFTSFTRTKDRLAHNTVLDLWEDAQGVLWIAGPGGVTRHEGDVWSILTALDGVGATEIWHILQDRVSALSGSAPPMA